MGGGGDFLHVWICKRYYQIVVSPTKVHERETSFHGYIEIVDMMYTMCIVQKYTNSALYYRTGASIYHQVSFIYLFSPIFYENKVNNRNMMSYISMYQRGQNQSMTNQKRGKNRPIFGMEGTSPYSAAKQGIPCNFM